MMLKLATKNDLPEISIYSVTSGNLSSQRLEESKASLLEAAQPVFIGLPISQLWVASFEYEQAQGFLLSAEYEQSAMENYLLANSKDEIGDLRLQIAIVSQQYLLDAIFTCLCYFPNDEDFFGPYFSRKAIGIISKYERMVVKCSDYGGLMSAAWEKRIAKIGQLIKAENNLMI